jgi:hypothetical protein
MRDVEGDGEEERAPSPRTFTVLVVVAKLSLVQAAVC